MGGALFSASSQTAREWHQNNKNTIDLDNYYRTEENVRKRIFKGPDAAIPSLGVESVHGLFRDLLRAMANGAWVTTTEGRAHGDLHGGNLLLDVAGNVWLIDFATTGPGHSLTDLAKLVVSCLGNYLPERMLVLRRHHKQARRRLLHPRKRQGHSRP